MKGFTIAILVCAVALASGNAITETEKAISPQNALDDFIVSIINSFKNVILNGNECLGIPALDPMYIPAIKLNMTSPLFKMVGDISEIRSEGLKSLEATKVSSNLISLAVELEMEMPEMYISGEYDVTGLVALLLPVYGKGPFYLRIGGVKVVGKAQLGVTLIGGYLSMKDLNFTIEVGEIFANFEGLLGGGDLSDVLNQIVNDMGLNVFNQVQDAIHDGLMTGLLSFMNAALDGVTLGDIIGGLIKPPGDDAGCDNSSNKF